MTGEHTIQGLLDAAARRLASLDGGRRDAEVLLAHVLGWTRGRLAAYGEIEPAAAEAERFAALVERRALGEPVAYLVGRREFWSLSLAVGPAVLVPRPETELLVERALELCDRAQARVADLGTGSGAIALALAHERPGWSVTAVDRSAAALATARANAATLGLGHVRFVEGDWFAPLAGERFDLVAANPPYVAADDPALEGDSLRFEPRSALTPGGADALADLRAIIAGAPAHLVPGGWLLLEHGATQADAVAAELVARGFAHVRSHPDLAGHPRMTVGRLA